MQNVPEKIDTDEFSVPDSDRNKRKQSVYLDC